MLKTVFVVGLLAFTLTGTAFGAGGDLDPASIKVLHDYQLSTAKVETFDKAYAALSAAGTADPALQKEIEAMGSEKTTNIADEIGKMSRHPKVYAFFEKAGLSKEDAVLLPLALTGGCVIAQHPAAAAQIPQVSKEQAAFCKANESEIKKLKLFGGKSG